MSGIVSYGVYLPYWRLQRSAITAALGTGGWLGGHLSYTLGAGVTASPPAAGTQATATTSSA